MVDNFNPEKKINKNGKKISCSSIPRLPKHLIDLSYDKNTLE